MVAWPPAISAISGFIIRVMMKYSAMLITAENGAPGQPLSPADGGLELLLDEADRDHVLRRRGFDAHVPAMMTSRPAKRLRLSTTLNARMKPIMIGTRHATRAVVLGTINDSRNPTTLRGIRRRHLKTTRSA